MKQWRKSFGGRGAALYQNSPALHDIFAGGSNYEKYFEGADLTSVPAQAGKPGLPEEFIRTGNKKRHIIIG
jgi:hypothetical protein